MKPNPRMAASYQSNAAFYAKHAMHCLAMMTSVGKKSDMYKLWKAEAINAQMSSNAHYAAARKSMGF